MPHPHEQPSARARHRETAPQYRDPLGSEGDAGLRAQLPQVSSDLLRGLRAALAESDFARATVIVRDGWFDLLLGDFPSLQRTVEQFSPAALRASPLLAMLAGLVYFGMPHRRATAVRLLLIATATASLDTRRSNPIDRAIVLVSAAVSFRLIGRPNQGVPLAKMASRILHELTEAQRESVSMLPRLYSQLGTTLYYGRQVLVALDVFEAGLSEIPSTGYRHGFGNLSMLAGIHALQGELSEARSFVELARDPAWTDAARVAYPGTFYQLAEAMLALEKFDSSRAHRHLDAMVHDPRTIEHWTSIAFVSALTELVDGHPARALTRIDAFTALRRSEGRSPAARHELAPIRALSLLAFGTPDAARAVLQRDAGRGPRASIARARVELVVGNHGAALQHLAPVASERLSPRETVEFRTIETAALLRTPGESRARAVVDYLGSTLEITGQRLALTFVPDADYHRVLAELDAAGYGHLLADMPSSSYVPDTNPRTRLTARERVVLHGLVEGRSAAEIAAESYVSINTVKTQLKGLYRKLGVSSRDAAVAVALRDRLLDDLPPLP